MGQPTPTKDSDRANIDLIRAITKEEYGKVSPLLENLLKDTLDLYEGKWPTHKACSVGYHTQGHALDVALATARMTAGWNKRNQAGIPEDIFLIGMASALFHDTGYLKDKGDNKGRGGKYTFAHVKRSMKLAAWYLNEKNWPAQAQEFVPRIISITEFHEPIRLEGMFDRTEVEIMARMVASADIVAQMADVDYMRHIHDLFEEFQEAYQHEPPENLKKKGVQIFSSAQEMIDNTKTFYEKFVVPRLVQLGGMDQYLISFFGNGRNPYLENINANLIDKPIENRIQWRRIGEVLSEMETVTPEQVGRVLDRQKRRAKRPHSPTKSSPSPLREKFLTWVDDQFSGKRFGDIAMETENIHPEALRDALLTQLLPPDLTKDLTSNELLAFLKIMVLIQNIYNGPWIFCQIMECINTMLDCEASSILLANQDAQEMVVAFPTGPKKDFVEKRTMPIDKGLAGWVYLHGRPAMVANAQQDERFHKEIDSAVNFKTRSILAVPLRVNGECIGVMEVLNKNTDSFNYHDMNILTLLANIITNSLVGALWLQELP